jgi:chromosome segregation ATPase
MSDGTEEGGGTYANAMPSEEWSGNMSELSEGQRSLCALAYVLAAACAGVAPAVLLVDEVDAALDGVNQSRVGDMLRHVAAHKGCQVWAVSHSEAFHGCCDAFLEVTRTCAGTAVKVALQGGDGNRRSGKMRKLAS